MAHLHYGDVEVAPGSGDIVTTYDSVAVSVLVEHAEGRIMHHNLGLCPDLFEGYDSRDPACPVCEALVSLRSIDARLVEERGPSEEDVEALAEVWRQHEPDQYDCDNEALVCSNPAHLAHALLASDWLAAHTAAAKARLGEAVKDLCWRAVRYGETDDGDTAYYLVTKGTMHRLVVAAQNAGVPATFRADDTKVIDDIAEAETRMVQAVETVLADWSPTYLRDDIDTASEVASTMAAELRAALAAAREAAARVGGEGRG